ncbi:MAG: tetratricopeptide repeat protein [Bryobacteraceae bacterium]
MERTQAITILATVSILGTVSPLLGSPASGDSPASGKISAAQQSIEKNPKSADGYVRLAMALAARARETSDPSYYDKANAELDRAAALAPESLDAARARIWVALGKHEFAHARELATALNKRVPDDLMTYALLVDANVELGRYDDAENAANWLLRLRPGNIPGFTRAAYLRELFGDLEGALDLMGKAFERTSPAETEERAWIMTHMSHLHLVAGNVAFAERAAKEALRLFPDYHYALAALAKIRAKQGRHADAAALFEKRYEAAPHPENLYDVAKAWSQSGDLERANAAYGAFEKGARAEMDGPDNSNRELIAYYAGEGNRPDEALRIAEMEHARRQDVHTLDAYALALHANGRDGEARRAIEKALAVGVRDPEILAHAASIK